MAEVVLVHGAFNELAGPHEIGRRWIPALQDGLWHHGARLGDDQVAVCFYGDLFRNDPAAADPTLERTRAGVADALTGLGGGDLAAVLGQAAGNAAFERTVDLAARLQCHPELFVQVRARVEAVVGPDTRALVAHSLGTVVTYMALCHHPEWMVDTLVTLGSPLGSEMVRAQLDPPPVDGVGVWPGAVQRWVNVAAVGDRAAVPLAPLFGSGVEDHLVDNGHHAHAPEPYLNAAVTGRAVAEALAISRG